MYERIKIHEFTSSDHPPQFYPGINMIVDNAKKYNMQEINCQDQAILREILYHQFNLETGDGVHLTWEFNRDLAGAISELAVTTPYNFLKNATEDTRMKFNIY